MKNKLDPITLWVIIAQMICAKTHTQLPLESSEAKSAVSPRPPENSEPQGGTGSSVEDRKAKAREYCKQYYLRTREKQLRQGIERWRKKYGPPKRIYGRSEEEKLALTKERNRKIYLANREARLGSAKQYRDEHPEQIKKDRQRARLRYKTDPSFKSKTLADGRRYYAKNPGPTIKRGVAYKNKRRRSDPIFRLRHLLATRIHQALNGELKRETTMQLLGCSREDFKAHLESLFQPGMSWENFGYGEGKWVLDHVVPIAAHDLSTLEGQRAAFHYSNTKPLWWRENLNKSSWHNGKQWKLKDHAVLPACTLAPEAAFSPA